MPEGETMGDRLRRLRHAAGLSQQRLADLAAVPLGSLRNWEQGRREPLLGPAGRLALALGVTLDELAGLARPALHEGGGA
jgi:transcriptional regulator with XRE-family HTH domain